MSRGNSIIVISPPRGVKTEGTLDDTSYPGTALEITPGSAFVNGRPHFRHYQPSADGDPRPRLILREDYLVGGTMTAQFAANSHVEAYFPLSGEDMNICVESQQGTGSANAYTIGERLIPNHTAGRFIIESTSSFGAWFMSMEHYDAVADQVGWLWAIRE